MSQPRFPRTQLCCRKRKHTYMKIRSGPADQSRSHIPGTWLTQHSTAQPCFRILSIGGCPGSSVDFPAVSTNGTASFAFVIHHILQTICHMTTCNKVSLSLFTQLDSGPSAKRDQITDAWIWGSGLSLVSRLKLMLYRVLLRYENEI